MQSIFDLFNSVYAELEDPSSPHFQLCLSILETVTQVGAAWACEEQLGRAGRGRAPAALLLQSAAFAAAFAAYYVKSAG